MIDFERITQAAELAVGATGGITAVTIAVVEGRHINYVRGFGRTRADGGTPVTTETIFPYSSICKMLNAIMIMRLVEDGYLELDRPILDYVPDFTFRNAVYGQQVTLRHLLSHTSGLPAMGRGYGSMTDDALAQAMREEMPHYRFSAQPGRLCIYASTVFCLSGYVAEVVMGRYYDDLLADYVLTPLGMTTPRWDLSKTPRTQLAHSHYRDAEGQLAVYEKFPSNRAGHPSSFYYGTTADLAKVAVMFLNAGQLLADETIAMMATAHGSQHLQNHPHFMGRQEMQYGLGLKIGEYRGRRLVRHGGMTPGECSYFQLFPDDNRAVVMQMTTVDFAAQVKLVQAVQDAVLELTPATTPYIATPQRAAPLPLDFDGAARTGRFIDPSQAQPIDITLVAGTLHLTMGDRTIPLDTYTASGEFIGPYTPDMPIIVYFELDADGVAQHVIVFGTVYQRNSEQPPATPDLTLWQQYVGRYQDPLNLDPDCIITVRLIDEHLYLWAGDPSDLVAQPLSTHRFLTSMGIAEFELSAENEVVALQIAHAARYLPVASL